MKSSEIAAKAAGIMAEKGHCKYEYQDPSTGAVCYRGAIRLAAGEWDTGEMVTEALIASYSIELLLLDADSRYESSVFEKDYPANSVALWNNRDNVTGEDVILLLKRTAERMAEAGL